MTEPTPDLPVADFVTLFARDPLKHTTADIESIVAKFRSMRGQFNSGNNKAGSTTTPKLTKVEAEVKAAGLNLDIDLGGL